MGPELLEIEPRELKFVFELKKQSSCLVQLTNNTNHYTAFKIKTTSPKRYCVRPNAGIVLPKSIIDVTVTLQPQRVTPSDMQCRDKFLVQSTVVPYGTTEEEIKPELFSKESGRFIENCKLGVVFLTPPHSPMLQQLKGSFKREKSFKETSFEAPTLKEATVLEEIPVRESLVLKKSPVLKETEVVPILKEASVLQESPLPIEAQVLKEAHMLKDQESTCAENICPSHVAKDAEELRLKLCHLESRLNESEKINTILREETSLAVLEKDKLQKELMILRTKSIARMQVGYPILFVCFIGLVGVVLGYLLHR